MTDISVKKGQEYELAIESLAYGGKGIARVNDFVIFVKNATTLGLISSLSSNQLYFHMKKNIFIFSSSIIMIIQSPI